MADRPSRIWKMLSPEKRLAAATAFWADEDDAAELAQFEAVAALARRLNFRTKSVVALPVERRAKQLAQMSDVSDGIASRALVSYHFAQERPLMAAFLDALGVKHDQGLIAEEEMSAPDAARVATAVQAVRGVFPDDAVDLYLRTLVALDGETWTALDAQLTSSS
jgi:hypothetical protein